MEPLSVSASIIGILGMAAKITETLGEFVIKEATAASSALRMIAELSDLRVCLAHLHPLIQGMKDAPASRVAEISVDDIVIITTSCVTALDDLDRSLNPYKLPLPLSIARRIRWVREERKMQQLVSRLQLSKRSLNLILTILNWSVIFDLIP